MIATIPLVAGVAKEVWDGTSQTYAQLYNVSSGSIEFWEGTPADYGTVEVLNVGVGVVLRLADKKYSAKASISGDVKILQNLYFDIVGGSGGGGGGGFPALMAHGYQSAADAEAGDFKAVYASPTTLAVSELPFVPLFGNFISIVEYDGDNAIASYDLTDEDFDWDWTPGADKTTGVLTVNTAAFGALNTFVVTIRGPKPEVVDVMTDFGGPYTHQSQRDFDAKWKTATSLDVGTVSAMVMSPDKDDFRAVAEISAGGKLRKVYTRISHAFTWAAGGAGFGVLTIVGADLLAGSTFIVFVAGPEHGTQRADAGGGIDQSVKRTQNQDLTGKVSPAGDTAGNAPFAKITDGTLDLAFKAASTAPTAGTIVVPTQVIDEAGKVLPAGEDADSAIVMRLLGLVGMMSGPGIYVSPIQFTAVQQAATALDLAGHPAVTDVSQFVMVVQISNVGVMTVHYPHISTGAFSWDAGNNRLTVTGATFAATDVFGVVLRGNDRYADAPGNFLMTGEVLPYPLRADDAGISLLAAAQNFTDAFVDCGSEIPMFGKSGCTFFITLDINDDADLRFRVLGKHTSAGAEEYSLVIKSPGAGVVAVEALYYEFTSDTDQLLVVRVETNGEIPYIQPQIMRGVNGAGVVAQVDALACIRGTFGGAS